MSVIGRLDGQVEEVIINPVGRRRAPDETAAPPPPVTPRDGPRETQHTGGAVPSRHERREDGELPVWLL